jgi:hypothetical protein
MQVTVRVRPGTGLALHRRQPPTHASEELLQVVAQLGVALAPMRPEVEEPSLAAYFTVEVPDPATAERVSARLLGTARAGVDGGPPPECLVGAIQALTSRNMQPPNGDIDEGAAPSAGHRGAKQPTGTLQPYLTHR